MVSEMDMLNKKKENHFFVINTKEKGGSLIKMNEKDRNRNCLRKCSDIVKMHSVSLFLH